VLPTWERRGLKKELPEGYESVIRCMPEDKTNGFFVSCFERVPEGEEKPVQQEEVGKKRAREVDDEEMEVDEQQAGKREKKEKEKTAAQIERNRRKKKMQKKKKVAVTSS